MRLAGSIRLGDYQMRILENAASTIIVLAAQALMVGVLVAL